MKDLVGAAGGVLAPNLHIAQYQLFHLHRIAQVISIRNDDNRCFEWVITDRCVLYVIYIDFETLKAARATHKQAGNVRSRNILCVGIPVLCPGENAVEHILEAVQNELNVSTDQRRLQALQRHGYGKRRPNFLRQGG